jgi:imidazole glycerol-phosphate synthase subunit HisF
MLKKRIISCLTVKDGKVVQSILFENYLPVGRVDISVEALNRWGIDEVVILDINATPSKRKPDFNIIEAAALKAFVPITFGGGITSVDEMRDAIHLGADKIAINTAALHNPVLIEKAAHVFGKQCIVVSVDAKRNQHGWFEVFACGGRQPTGLHAEDWAQEADRLGAGEILLNSIDHDGAQKGFDLELLRLVQERVNIPIIGCGGAGHPEHFFEAFNRTHVAALAAGNYFHFTEQSPVVTKAYLKQNGVHVRLDTDATYDDIDFSANGRASKRSEQYLRELRYQMIKNEVI